MADLSELWSAIGSVLAGDATLIGMLPSAQMIVYDESKAPKQLDFPAVRFLLVDDGEDMHLDGGGYFRPRLQIDVFGTDQRENRQVYKRIDELLWVPINRAGGIDSDNFTVRLMYRASGLRPIDTGIDYEGARVIQLTADWNLAVTEKR